MRIKRISRKLYNSVVGYNERVKALALAIFLKEHHPASVLKGWSYAQIAKEANISYNTARKRISTLRAMHLAHICGRAGEYLVLSPLRSKKLVNKKQKNPDKIAYCNPRRSNIGIDRLDHRTIKSLEIGLMAMLIVEIQRRKLYKRQLIERAHQRAECRKRGETVNDKFIENGISRKTLAKRLSCGQATLTKIFEYGRRRRLFTRIVPKAAQIYAGYGKAVERVEVGELMEFSNTTFNTLSNFYKQGAAVFRLPAVLSLSRY